MRNHSYENVFPLQVHFLANQIHFLIKGFARGLVWKQSYKPTRKWLIVESLVALPMFLKGDSLPGVEGWGLSYMGYIDMCDPKGYGFPAVLIINRVWFFAL